MAIFGNDYDRNYGRYRAANRGYDRGFVGGRRGNWNHLETEGGPTLRGYDQNQFRGARQDWVAGGGMGYDRNYGYTGTDRVYDRDYGYSGANRYDRGYKSDWETDYGDPFGDRESRTPMRVINGEYHGYDRGYNTGAAYDRNYTGYSNNPATYDPYYGGGRAGTWNRGYDRGFRTSNRGYDTGWY